MDIATGLGLLAGAVVVCTLIFMGGDLRMFISDHAVIIIFGGSFAATLIRFPLSSIFHGLPLGAKFAFTMRRMTQRELVDEIAGLAEIARKQGPIGLEKVEIEDPFLAKGIRFVADGYDAEFIRDNLERDRDNFLTHLDEGQKIYRAVGDCAPAFGMIGTLVGMVQMFANMTDPVETWAVHGDGLLATLYGAVVANIICLPIADKLHCKLVDEEDQSHADHRRRADDPRVEEPDAGARNAARLSAGEASRTKPSPMPVPRLTAKKAEDHESWHGARKLTAAATAGSSPSPTSWACWSASSSCWSRSPIRTRRSCRSSPARCATPSACRPTCAIPASSKSTACRPGRS